MAKYIHDITITRGESFGREIIFENMDLTGLTAKAQVRPAPGSEDLLAEFGCDIDYSRGAVRLTLTPAQTGPMAPGKHAYDVWLLGGADVRRCYLAGRFIVLERVTQEENNG